MESRIIFNRRLSIPKKSGIEEALEDVKAGRVFHAKDAHDLIKQCLE